MTKFIAIDEEFEEWIHSLEEAILAFLIIWRK